MKIEKNMEGTQYESIQLKGKKLQLYINSKDSDGEVEINDDNKSIYLSQDHLKTVIEFLQKQLV